MAAHHNVNPDQLKLFMGGQEWQSSISDSVDRGMDESMGDVWSRRLQNPRPSTVS